ncbi:MAG: hypothetical protein U0797_26245 [Gemmataceae bacterium]
MHDRTTAPASPSTSPATNDAAARQLLAGVPLYAAASPEQRQAIEADMAGMLSAGMAPEDYLTALATWDGTAAHYLASRPDADQGEINPAFDAAAKAEQAAREEEQREAAARKECQATMTALVRAYRAGEKAYRAGLLEAGRLSVEYIAKRLAIGDRRAAAVQAIEGQLAAVSSDAVDVSRLVRCWEAFRLLAVAQQLDQPESKGKAAPADAVAYGHYRDGWALLLVRQAKDTAAETFTLLPGLESQCLAAYKHAVAEGLSKAAVVERCQQLVGAHAQRESERAAAEREAKAKAEQEATARAAAETKAREAADLAAKVAADQLAAAEQASRAAADDRQREQAAKDRATAEAAALKAKGEADRKRAVEEQAARDAARAKREATEAARRQAEAEAARSKEERRRQEREQRKQQRQAGKGNQQPPAESRQGTNILASARAAVPKDCADLLRSAIAGHDDPHATLHDLVVSLLANPSAGLSTDDVVRTIFLALDGAKLPGQLGDAVKAGRLILNRKPAVKPADQPAPHPSTNGQVCAA